ncbi:MAG: dienelactone hydrolase family protein [Polyangiales bacterium]
MLGSKLEIATPDGVSDAYVTHPAGDGPWPVILYFTDAFGLREVVHAMCDRLAACGYFVVAPNLLYRQGGVSPFDPKTVFTTPTEMQRLMKVISSLDDAAVTRDVGAYLSFVATQAKAREGKIGAVGYCMGGGCAILAACEYPDRFGAVASFQGVASWSSRPARRASPSERAQRSTSASRRSIAATTRPSPIASRPRSRRRG